MHGDVLLNLPGEIQEPEPGEIEAPYSLSSTKAGEQWSRID